mgnify:CR=1 FL=1
MNDGLQSTAELNDMIFQAAQRARAPYQDMADSIAKMGLNAGLTVGGYYVKGLGQIFYFSKGLIKPDEGRNRIQSAFHNVYENTPFVFLEKGEEVNIEEGDLLVLKFYHSDVPKWRFIKRQK